MIDDVTINLAPFLNFVIYIVIFFIVNFLLRRLVRVIYGGKIVRICKTRVLEIFTEHYRKHGFNNKEELKMNLYSLDYEIKKRFNLNYNPLVLYDLETEYGNWDEIPISFGIASVYIYKRMWFYHMKFKKFDKYNGERIRYKDCVKENRENKIDNLLD